MRTIGTGRTVTTQFIYTDLYLEKNVEIGRLHIKRNICTKTIIILTNSTSRWHFM